VSLPWPSGIPRQPPSQRRMPTITRALVMRLTSS
jgi:hypothetical protein